jgi:hypothetical protein
VSKVAYPRLLRCALMLAAGSLLMACSQQQPAIKAVQAADPPRDYKFADTARHVDRFVSEHGAFGHYYDERSGVFIVVFPADVGAPPSDQIATQLQARVRVEHAAMTRETYNSIETEVAHLHSERRGSTYAIYLDLPSGKAVLSSDLPSDVLQPLMRKYDGLIELRSGSIRLDLSRP